ncbi:MFS transporter [Xylocopilactobacillus apis]|uniref:MFS transporter n=1 Tax=Xylocopilactobacillus apis TaxID=2932183 RepID=A0AAU9D093_9LACO|nr:MFS transporter [Xylocopilactobacillus apis]BDR57054.1 MFS transporter [Xylocopilactobacillus apis]
MELSKNRKNLLVLILALGTFGVTNTEMGIMGILPIISRQYNVSIATAGGLVSYFALIIAICGPFLPALLARFNKKKIMLLAIGLFVVSCLASAFITDFKLLLLARLLPAFLHPVFVSYAMSTAALIADNNAESSRFVSRVFMGVSAGMVLGVPLANLIASLGSFRLVMLTFAAINTLILIACAVYLISIKDQNTQSFKAQMKALIQPQTLIGIVTIICLNGAVFGFYSYLSDFLEKVSLLSAVVISALLLVYGLANVLGNGLAGSLLASNPHKVLVDLPIVMLVPYLIIYFLNQNLFLSFILILIMGTFAGIDQNLNQYIMNDALKESPDLANGLFITGANLGTTFGSMIAGKFITTWGTKSSLLATEILLVIAIVIIMLNPYFKKKKNS